MCSKVNRLYGKKNSIQLKLFIQINFPIYSTCFRQNFDLKKTKMIIYDPFTV